HSRISQFMDKGRLVLSGRMGAVALAQGANSRRGRQRIPETAAPPNRFRTRPFKRQRDQLL
ncbi:MAG TPA: hypothetical protein PLQ12_06465, partial [Candidatus Defluviicoccus seviourii]|nr:hypothetical protein [Candidatus Defluviicoccus seviourii]